MVERVAAAILKQRLGCDWLECSTGEQAEALDEARAAIAALEASQRWQPIDDSVPRACHMLATYFDDSAGEWCVSVVMYPFAGPWTHWQPLPEPPSLEGSGQ